MTGHPVHDIELNDTQANLEVGDFYVQNSFEFYRTPPPRCVLASSRLVMPCYGETKYMVLMYGPWGFQKCIWEP